MANYIDITYQIDMHRIDEVIENLSNLKQQYGNLIIYLEIDSHPNSEKKCPKIHMQ
jgi:hypothetical protein